jgi:CheY-like chemotaxis protein
MRTSSLPDQELQPFVVALQHALTEMTREASRLEAKLGAAGSIDAVGTVHAIVDSVTRLAGQLTQLVAPPAPPITPAPAAAVRTPHARARAGYVLLVEEEPTGVELLAAGLRQDGLEIEIATQPEQALSQAATRRPLAVVVDLDLQGSRGPDLVWRLRSQIGEVPIVLLTTQAIDHPAVATAIELFDSSYLAKPFDPNELLATIQRSLART